MVEHSGSASPFVRPRGSGRAEDPGRAGGPEWEPDVLGPDFSALTLDLPLPNTVGRSPAGATPAEAVDPGPTATLVAYRGPVDTSAPLAGKHVVVYLHGWSDYFHQADLARWWASRGAHFYAIDLRAYGRNLKPAPGSRPGVTPVAETFPGVRPGYIGDLEEYDAEISAALDVIGAEHPARRIVLEGHSTGGLVWTLWADRAPRPDWEIAGLVLGSPWLEFQFTAAARRFLGPIVSLAARTTDAPLPVSMPNFYTLSVGETQGHIPFDQRWKPAQSFPVYPGWLTAVFAGHRRIEEGLDLTVPVFVQISASTIHRPRYDSKMSRADIILDVDVIARRAVTLGHEVLVHRLEGALHDVYLSAPEVRAEAFAGLDRFVLGYLSADSR